MIFDTHAHYDDDAFDDDRDELLSGMREQNVEYIVNVGASMASSERSIKLAEKYPFVYAGVGVRDKVPCVFCGNLELFSQQP